MGSTVDVDGASYTNTIGDPELSVVWEDPDFEASERAFYYMRVLENPTCRWHVEKCREYGVDRQRPGLAYSL